MTLLDSSPRPEILIVAPPPLTPTDEPFFAALFNDAIEESKLFAHWYSDLATKKGVHFFDAGQVCETSRSMPCIWTPKTHARSVRRSRRWSGASWMG